MSLRSGSRTASLAAVLVALLAWAAAPTGAQATTVHRARRRAAPYTQAEVTFTASGEYVLHGYYGDGAGSWNGTATVPFSLEAQFFAAVSRSASDRAGGGKLQGAKGVLLHWETGSSEEVLVATESGSVHQQCSTVAMPEAAGAAAPALRVGKAGVSVESLTALSVSPQDYIPQCQASPWPYGPQPGPWLEPVLIADSLDPSLPAAFAAQLPAAAARLDYGQTATYPVSSHGISGGCPAGLPISCTQEVSWTGTVKIEDECAKRVCIKEKAKEEAEAAAKEYAKETAEESYNDKVNCTGWALKLTKKEPGGTAFCAAMGAKLNYDSFQAQHYRAIANDPPDARAAIPKPHPPHAKHLGALRRAAPAAYALIARYLKVVGLSGAVMSAQNRGSGAYAELTEGKAGAASALARLGRAEVSYAKRGSRLLRGQHRLARRAAAELRRIAPRPRRARSGQRAKAVRRFLAGIASKRAGRLDRRAAATLGGIRG